MNALKSPPDQPTQEHIKLICAWCGKDINHGSPMKGISHGICPACYQKLLGQVKAVPATKTAHHLN